MPLSGILLRGNQIGGVGGWGGQIPFEGAAPASSSGLKGRAVYTQQSLCSRPPSLHVIFSLDTPLSVNWAGNTVMAVVYLGVGASGCGSRTAALLTDSTSPLVTG